MSQLHRSRTKQFPRKKHRSSSDLKLTKCLRLVRFLIWEVESCFSLWWKCWCYHIYCRICSLILVSFMGMLSLIVEPCFPLLENCCCLYLDSSHDLLIFFLQATTMMCYHPLMISVCLFFPSQKADLSSVEIESYGPTKQIFLIWDTTKASIFFLSEKLLMCQGKYFIENASVLEVWRKLSNHSLLKDFHVKFFFPVNIIAVLIVVTEAFSNWMPELLFL